MKPRWGRIRGGRSAVAVFVLALLAVGAVATVGCGGADRPAVRVEEPPPLPRAETAPIKPGPNQVWVPGFWDWDANVGTWRWVDGGWQVPPRPGAVWVAPRHELHGHSWVLVRGYWR